MSAVPRQTPRRVEHGICGLSIYDVQYEARLQQPRHFHEHTTATLVLGGSIEETVGSARECAVPLSVVFKPAGTEHANRIGSRGATTLQLSFESHFLEICGASACPADWGWAHGGSPARRFLGVVTAWRSARDDDVQLESYVYDLLGELWVTGALVSSGDTRGSTAPLWLRTTVEELEDTFDAPRRVRDLAADAGVHPVALARAHRRHFGCSISGRIKRRRVAAAAELLRRSEVPLSSVAYRTGFSDQSHLTRVFKAETGVTPGRYRKLLTA